MNVSYVNVGLEMNIISYKTIGLIHTPFTQPKGTPIQPTAGQGIEGSIEIFPKYAEGLKDIAEFSLRWSPKLGQVVK